MRNDSGKVKQICGCISHDDWTYSSLYSVWNISKSKIFGSRIIGKMRRMRHLLPKSNNLCAVC